MQDGDISKGLRAIRGDAAEVVVKAEATVDAAMEATVDAAMEVTVDAAMEAAGEVAVEAAVGAEGGPAKRRRV